MAEDGFRVGLNKWKAYEHHCNQINYLRLDFTPAVPHGSNLTQSVELPHTRTYLAYSSCSTKAIEKSLTLN